MTSKPEYELKLSQEAYDDLVHIQNYTFTKFGSEQWESYKTIFDTAFLTLIENPHIGHEKEALPQPYRALLIGHHLAVYRIEENTIFIVRIIHQRMSIQFDQ